MKSPANRRELTVPFIKSLGSNSAIGLIWDERQPGLALRVHHSGRASFVAIYRHAGRNRWYAIGSTKRIALSDAREVTRKIIARATLGEDPQGTKVAARAAAKAGGSETLNAIAERYVEQFAKKRQKAWMQGDKIRRRYILPMLGNKKLAAITRHDVEAIFDDLTARGRAVLANQVVAHLSAVLSWAVAKHLVAGNACTGIAFNPTSSRTRILSESEVPQFWEALDTIDDVSARALRTLLLLGQRPGEIRRMRQRDLTVGEFVFERHRPDGRIDRQRVHGAWWDLPGAPDPDGSWAGTKNGSPHRVWVPETVVKIFAPLLDGKSVYVFHRPNGRVIGALAEDMARVGEALGWNRQTKATPHDLRRSHGTTITSLGFTREQMDRIQNHREGGVGSVYDRFEYSDEARRIQEAVAARLLALAERRADADNVVELPQSTKA